MAAVEVTISGVLYDKYNRDQKNVVLIGEAVISGLQVGGGPIIPPGQPQPPSGAHPEHPIYFPDEGQPPPSGAHPEHPIVLPPDLPPQTPEGPIDWKVGWTEETGWIVVGIPTGEHVTPSKKRR